jgi:hypothetical protein
VVILPSNVDGLIKDLRILVQTGVRILEKLEAKL